MDAPLLSIHSQSHPYDVREAPTFRAALQRAASSSVPQDTFYLLDARVAQLYASDIEELTLPSRRLAIAASEEAKSYEQLGEVFGAILRAGFRRNSHLVVVGGGVLQDIGCFVASVLMRGVRWSLLPTTLLAQCDSCIGSKSSLNVAGFKNQLGTFYAPHEVVLAPSVLRTLPRDDVRSGLGEAIKLHLIAGEDALGRLKDELALLETDADALRRLIVSSLLIKKPFIEEDEFDRARRKLLNYGHTFAHAFESATNYEIPHGIAVTLGVLSATWMSWQLGLVEESHFQELLVWLRPFYTPFERKLAIAEASRIEAVMKLDKKNENAGATFVLTRGPGKMELVTIEREKVAPLMEDLMQMWSV